MFPQYSGFLIIAYGPCVTKLEPPTPDVVLVSLPAYPTDHTLIASPIITTQNPVTMEYKVGSIKRIMQKTNGKGV